MVLGRVKCMSRNFSDVALRIKVRLRHPMQKAGVHTGWHSLYRYPRLFNMKLRDHCHLSYRF